MRIQCCSVVQWDLAKYVLLTQSMHSMMVAQWHAHDPHPLTHKSTIHTLKHNTHTHRYRPQAHPTVAMVNAQCQKSGGNLPWMSSASSWWCFYQKGREKSDCRCPLCYFFQAFNESQRPAHGEGQDLRLDARQDRAAPALPELEALRPCGFHRVTVPANRMGHTRTASQTHRPKDQIGQYRPSISAQKKEMGVCVRVCE